MNRSAILVLAPLAAALTLPGCGGSNLAGMPAASSALAATATQAHRAANPWMKPARRAQELLYITDSGSATVKVYTYPGLSYTGELTGFVQPLFDCADNSGNVWISDYGPSGALYEYAHGGTTPIKELTGVSYPYACAINRQNGDLAVAINRETGSVKLGEVAVYHNGSGRPSIHSDHNFTLNTGLAYDNSGNLFIDGFAAGDVFHYAELPAGSSTFTDITLSTTPNAPGAVVWDGQYIDVGDESNIIYQTQGSTVVKTISLKLSQDTLRGFFVPSAKKLIAPDAYANVVGAFNYPHGHSAKKSITSGLNTPWDVVISE
ncbi:MAG: hypothetical protein WB615_11020 [Candidatus Tumulicola sp.]